MSLEIGGLSLGTSWLVGAQFASRVWVSSCVNSRLSRVAPRFSPAPVAELALPHKHSFLFRNHAPLSGFCYPVGRRGGLRYGPLLPVMLSGSSVLGLLICQRALPSRPLHSLALPSVSRNQH